MDLCKWALVAATAFLLLSTTAPRGDVIVPSTLAGYRSWKELTPGPRLMPYELAVQCMPVTDTQLEQARKSHGPHSNLWAAVYANPAALATLSSKDAKVFPSGAILAKEKRRRREDGTPEGVAFMIKHPKGEFVASHGWEFVYYPSAGPRSSYERCVSCHQSGASKDYVFSRLPSSDAAAN
jgi:hypothetical protein